MIETDTSTEASPPRFGSAAASEQDGVMSVRVDLPWDDYLGAGATARITDGSLALVRHAYPAAAAQDMRDCTSTGGLLYGDAGDHERLAAIAVGVASTRHRPMRLPHRPGDEPHAWWIDEERTLVWLPWVDIDEPAYGLRLLDDGEADAVMVLAPDAIWTVYASGIPTGGSAGGWSELSERLQAGLLKSITEEERPKVRWNRPLGSDSLLLQWRAGDGRLRRATVAVNQRQDSL